MRSRHAVMALALSGAAAIAMPASAAERPLIPIAAAYGGFGRTGSERAAAPPAIPTVFATGRPVFSAIR